MSEHMNIRACLREGHPVTYRGQRSYIYEILSFTQCQIINDIKTMKKVVQVDDLIVGWGGASNA